MSIRIGIMGYGNLGRGIECAIRHNPDMELAAIFTRRAPESLQPLTENVKVYAAGSAAAHRDEIDVLILCGGSATDLPVQTPEYAKYFNVVDSFDTHARIPEHFAAVDAAAKEGGKVAVISCGWDPGMFSLSRLYANAILPGGVDYTFWGKGVSQGHSDAIRRVPGRRRCQAVHHSLRRGPGRRPQRRESQPEHPAKALARVLSSSPRRAQTWGASNAKSKPCPTTSTSTTPWCTSSASRSSAGDHSGIPHGGFVIRSGKTGWNDEHNNVIEYSLKLDSNPEFTLQRPRRLRQSRPPHGRRRPNGLQDPLRHPSRLPRAASRPRNCGRICSKRPPQLISPHKEGPIRHLYRCRIGPFSFYLSMLAPFQIRVLYINSTSWSSKSTSWPKIELLM